MNRVTNDDALFGYRLQLFDLAARTSVSEACRTFGVHRSTYYAWRKQVERHGLEILRPRERRRPKMPNQLSAMVEQRILAFSIAHPGLGPRKVSSALAQPRWGGLVVSPNGVWRCLRRHGLSTRTKRLSLVAGYRAPYEPPPRARARAAHRGRAGRRAGRHGLLLRRSPARHQGRDLAALGDRHPLPRSPGPSSSSAGRATPASPQSRRSSGTGRVAPTSAPGAPRPTVTSKRSRRRSSTSAGARPLPAAIADGTQARARRLPALSQPRAPTRRPTDERQDPRRTRLPCPQNGGEMSRHRRHISEAVHPRRSRRRGLAGLSMCPQLLLAAGYVVHGQRRTGLLRDRRCLRDDPGAADLPPLRRVQWLLDGHSPTNPEWGARPISSSAVRRRFPAFAAGW
jgi:transposase